MLIFNTHMFQPSPDSTFEKDDNPDCLFCYIKNKKSICSELIRNSLAKKYCEQINRFYHAKIITNILEKIQFC